MNWTAEAVTRRHFSSGITDKTSSENQELYERAVASYLKNRAS